MRDENISPLTQPYYTVKFTKIQAILAKMGIFVIYDNFYVNIIMLTYENPMDLHLSF